MADRYTESSRVVSVAVKDMTIRYGFRSTLAPAKGTVLGHSIATDANGVLLPSVILGANNPKPPRAQIKRTSGETDSSFISFGSIAGARTAGWKVEAGKITFPRRTNLSIPVFVSVASGDGETAPRFNYGWRMPKYQHDIIGGEFAILGIELVTITNYGGVWFGVNSPKPRRASRAIAGDNDSTISTFVSSAREATVGVGGTAEAPTATGWALAGTGRAYRGNFGL